jgi:3-oxoacyl-[acyl-carrier-protein] synthase-3
MGSCISAIATYLPEKCETVQDLEILFPEWSSRKISDKTGIETRHIASPKEFASDLAISAGQKLLIEAGINRDSIDLLITISQTPDHILPGISFLVHRALGLKRNAGAFDLNLGCSGYVYGLAMAKGMVESGQCDQVLVITSDTYSKILNPMDKSVRSIFGDGATATLVSKSPDDAIKGFTQGSNGDGAGKLMVPNGGIRPGSDLNPNSAPEVRGLDESGFDIYMDGPGIFNFTLEVVGDLVRDTLFASGTTAEEIDYFVFHQANAFMLQHIVTKLGLPEDKCPVVMKHWGNTVSGTIPMAICELRKMGQMQSGKKLLLAGFGVGLSWAGLAVDIKQGIFLNGHS